VKTYLHSVRKALAWLAAYAFALALSVAAEPAYLVDAWQTEDGLPQNTVKAVTQTRDGYLWFGTFDGLVRFDGIQFTVFTVANTPGLRSGDISCLLEDKEGRLWIGTDGEGLVCYQQGTFGPGPGNDGRALKIMAIAQTREGPLLVATTTGVFRLAPAGWEPVPVPDVDFTNPTIYSYLAQNAAGDLWLTHRQRLYRISNGAPELRQSFPAPIGALFVEADGTVLCGVNDAPIAEIPIRGEPRYNDSLATTWHSIRRTVNGDLWMTTREGLYRQRGTNRLHITTAEGLITDDVSGIFEDREGNLWVQTNGGGLHRLREKLVQIHSTRNGLASNDTISVLQDRDGRVWLGTFKGGVSVFEKGRWEPVPLPAEPVLEPNIASLCQTRDGSIWLAGHQLGGIHDFHYRWKAGQLETISIRGFDAVRVLFEDRDGGLWIGSRNAGLEYRLGNETRRYDVSNGLSRNEITAIVQDSSGVIWVGTTRGLNRLAPDGLRTFFRKDGLGSDGIYALWRDAEETLWIGTAGGGLTRFKDGRFDTITTEQGLLSNVIGQLIEDDFGYLWMGTTAGIARARKQDLHDTLDGKTRFVPGSSFGKSEGLNQSECANGFQPACMKARDGTLWFCTIGGAVVIDPKRIRRNEMPPPVHIEKLIFDDKTVIPKRGSHADDGTITIPPGTGRFEVHYTGLSLVAPAKVRFRFQLEGYDADWLQAGSQRVAHYTRVPHGRYQFRVTAANNDGVWNEDAVVLPIWIKPHFRETLWFRLLTGLAVIGPVLAVIWLRLIDLRNVQALRLRIAQDLHDEAGSNLGSIQLLSRRAAKRLVHQENPQAELAEIHRITSATAESIRDVVWLIDPEFDTLEQMLKGMETVCARLLADMSCNTRWSVTRRDRKLSLEFRSNLFLMFKEILHNVQKHSQATHIEIELTEDHGLLELRVRDNGVGFDPERTSGGHGLNSLKRRASELGGQVNIDSGRGNGTSVTLKFKPS
jgi:ligand-binding sensor domain-containing protein/two-component sensor histidine kinase